MIVRRVRTLPLIVLLATAGLSSTTGVASAAAPSGDCVESIGTPPPPAESASADSGAPTDPAATTFGPLSLEPVLDISTSAPILAWQRVTDGMIVATATSPEVSAVTRVDDDGTVAWTRCIADDYVNLIAAPTGTAVVVTTTTSDASALTTTESVAFDLATGADVALPAGLPTGLDTQVLSWDGRFFLFGPTADGNPFEEGQSLTLIDAATMTATPLGLPDGAVGQPFPNVLVNDEGAVAYYADSGFGPASAVWVDGAWTSDPAALDANVPLWTTYSTLDPVVYYRGSGAEAFDLSGYVDPGDEGFRSSDVGADTYIVRACTDDGISDALCVVLDLIAVDTTTGAFRWTLPGGGGVMAGGDGYALLGTMDGLFMVDAVTGQPIEGQEWPDGTFLAGCCADPSFTTRVGNEVVTGDDVGLRVFVPLDQSAPTVTVTL